MKRIPKDAKIVMCDDTLCKRYEHELKYFMWTMFALDSYLITDRSALSDFKGVNGLETIDDMHRKMKSLWGKDVSELGDAFLVDLMASFYESNTQ